MCHIVCVFDTDTGENIIRDDIMDQRLLENICKRDMPEIRCASDTKLEMSGTITVQLCTGELRNLVAFGVLDKVTMPVII